MVELVLLRTSIIVLISFKGMSSAKIFCNVLVIVANVSFVGTKSSTSLGDLLQLYPIIAEPHHD